MCDYVRLSFRDFVEGLQPLRDVSTLSKNRFAFDFLDVDKDGQIDVLSMIQIYKDLPDRCLMRCELLLLLEEYKAKNILPLYPGLRLKPIDFSTYIKLIP